MRLIICVYIYMQESVKFVQRVAVEEYNQSTTRGMPDSDCSQIMLWRIQTTL